MVKLILGYALMATPFIGITWAIVAKDGWKCAAFCWVFTVVVLGAVCSGAYLAGWF